MPQISVNSHDCQSCRIKCLLRNFRIIKVWFFMELVIRYGRSWKLHFHIFCWISLKSLDGVALHSPDHGLSPGSCVPTRRTPIRIRESFHLSMNMFARTLSNDKSQQLSTVCQIHEGSLEALRLLGSLTPNMHKCEMSSKGAFRGFRMAS